MNPPIQQLYTALAADDLKTIRALLRSGMHDTIIADARFQHWAVGYGRRSLAGGTKRRCRQCGTEETAAFTRSPWRCDACHTAGKEAKKGKVAT